MLGEERSGIRAAQAHLTGEVDGQGRELRIVEGFGRVPVEDPRHIGRPSGTRADLLDHQVQQIGVAQDSEGGRWVGRGRGRFRCGQQVRHERRGVRRLRPQSSQIPQIVVGGRVARGLWRGPAEHRRGLPRPRRRREEEPQFVLGPAGPGRAAQPGPAGVRQEGADRVEYPHPLRAVRQRSSGARDEGHLPAVQQQRGDAGHPAEPQVVNDGGEFVRGRARHRERGRGIVGLGVSSRALSIPDQVRAARRVTVQSSRVSCQV